MAIQSKAKNQKFEQIFKLFQIVTDPEVKENLQQQMLELVGTPLHTFSAVEKELYGSAKNPIVMDSSDSEELEDQPSEEVKEEPPEDTTWAKQVIPTPTPTPTLKP